MRPAACATLERVDRSMDERDFFIEARTQKTATLNCPFCKTTNEYALAWMVRKKRTNINLARLDERDRAKFEKAQSYMVLLDDHATCHEPGCRRHFEISGVKTMAFVTPEQLEEIRFHDGGGRDRGGRQPARGGRRAEERQPRGPGQDFRKSGYRENQGSSQGPAKRRDGGQPASPQHSRWGDQQGSRSPRGKRPDPTGPGGGWR